MRKPVNMLVMAVVIAALGTLLVYRYLSDQQAELDAAREAAMGAVINVAVADSDIPIGTKVKLGQARLVKWPSDAAPVGVMTTIEEAEGKLARVTIRRNQPLVQTDLTSEMSGLLPLLIDEGLRAMSVHVDRVTGVSGFITPESHVDVLAAGNIASGDGEREPRSKLILQNIKVLAIGKQIEQRDDGGVEEVPTVTLMVSPGDAEKLTLAAKDEPVRLALRNFRDGAGVDTPGMSAKVLFEIAADLPLAAPPSAPEAPRRVVARKAPAPSMEILLGEEVTRQSY